MIFFLKFIGAFIGYKIAGHLGAICGFILGLSFDSGLSAQIEKRRWQKVARIRAENHANESFFQQTVSMLAKLAAADGLLTPEEDDAFAEILDRVFKLKKKKKREALKLFHATAQSPSTFQFHAAQFQSYFQNQMPILEGMVDILCSLAASDGVVNRAEETLIHSAVAIFGISEERYATILGQYVVVEHRAQQSDTSARAAIGRNVGKNEWHYVMLGCSKSDSESDIKRQYRKLVSEYHPDKIVSKDLPPDFVEFAHKKFRDIQVAYETVKRERGFH